MPNEDAGVESAWFFALVMVALAVVLGIVCYHFYICKFKDLMFYIGGQDGNFFYR